jgi:hypothetical protein
MMLAMYPATVNMLAEYTIRPFPEEVNGRCAVNHTGPLQRAEV